MLQNPHQHSLRIFCVASESGPGFLKANIWADVGASCNTDWPCCLCFGIKWFWSSLEPQFDPWFIYSGMWARQTNHFASDTIKQPWVPSGSAVPIYFVFLFGKSLLQELCTQFGVLIPSVCRWQPNTFYGHNIRLFWHTKNTFSQCGAEKQLQWWNQFLLCSLCQLLWWMSWHVAGIHHLTDQLEFH